LPRRRRTPRIASTAACPCRPTPHSVVAAGGGWRAFCCAGCEAVARVIGGQGLDDYYRLRTAASPRPEADPSADDAALYDEPAVQSGCVRDTAGGMREASLVVEGIRCAACAWLVERAALCA
jgi:Cu2+-exporting ATPase